MIMAQRRHGHGDSMPEEIRAICTGLCRDVAALQLKWDTYLGLLASPEVAALLSDTAPAFFQVVAESLRNDIVQSICRLGDPSRALGPDDQSMATLVARCPDVPRAEDLLTAFQAACGPVRRYRHRQLGHEDPGERIRPREDLLPDIGWARIDEILQLAGGVLKAVHRYYSAGDPALRPAPVGGVVALIFRLRSVLELERKQGQRPPPGAEA
jgi:AbiU2